MRSSLDRDFTMEYKMNVFQDKAVTKRMAITAATPGESVAQYCGVVSLRLTFSNKQINVRSDISSSTSLFDPEPLHKESDIVDNWRMRSTSLRAVQDVY